ncbi:MAG TPA: cupin domain-containing protein [bacterium]|jgi:quercetin dioxygenase-like cupin family protein
MLVREKFAAKANPVQDEGAQKARIAVLIGPEEGAPNFVMRRIELDEGGCTPHHAHNWEHVVYILEGQGKLKGEKGELELKPGSSVLVLANERHQFVAESDKPLVFLCSIPKR